MDLLIRSQDKERLVKNYADIYIFNACQEDEEYLERCIYAYINEDRQILLGEYNTPERALEVLDEIQNKMNPKYFYKTSCLMKPEQMEKMETNLIQKHNADCIVGFVDDEIEPLSNDVLVYEMPEE